MCWDIKCVGISSVLGYQERWDIKSVGISSVLGYQVCWDIKCVGISSVLGYQERWDIKSVGISSVFKLADFLRPQKSSSELSYFFEWSSTIFL